MLDRRHFLKIGFGTTSAILLPGCCPKSKQIVYTQDTKPIWKSNFYPLSPNKISLAQAPRPMIDTHVHIFNASDLQVAGFLSGPIAYSFTNNTALISIIRKLAKPIEVISQSMAISAKDEFEFLNEQSNKSLQSVEKSLENKSNEIREEAIDKLYKAIKGKKVEAEINDYLRSSNGLLSSSSKQIYIEFSKDFLNEAYDLDSNLTENKNTFGDSQFGLGEVLGFIFKLLKMRFTNLKTYQKFYSEQPGSITVTSCYASIVDFDYWIGRCDHTYSSLDDQVKVMEKISELSGGYMTPMVAYNPLTDIKENGASLDLVSRAIKNHNFAGVKIYPPMGFFPYGNATSPNYPTDAVRVDLKQLDERLNALYKLCKDLKVPVMAHSNESMGRLPSHDILGGPEGWSAVFSQSQNHGLKINLAHFGGEEGGGSGEDGWTAKFIDLMKQPGSEGIYGDLGFWYEVVSKSGDAVERLKKHLSIPLSNGETVADRVMFGSDWSMIATQKGWQTYASAFNDAMKDLDSETINKIYYQNAEKLFSRTMP